MQRLVTHRLKSFSRRIGMAAATAMTLLTVAGSGVAQAETWRFATILTPDNQISEMLENAASEIEDQTDGRIEFQIAYGSESGLQSRQYLDSVKMGLIDGAVIPTSGAAADYPWLAAYNVPFLAPDVAKRRPMFEATEPMLNDFLSEQNIVPLAYPLHAPRWSVMYLTEPVENLDGFQGRMIRTYDPNTIALVKGVGATPASLQKSEVYQGLQRGTIDGAITDIAAAKEESYAEVVKAVLRLNPLFLPNIIGINKNSFDKISPEDQDIVRTVFADAQEKYWELITPSGEDDSFDYVKSQGVEVEIPDDEMMSALLKVRDEQTEVVEDQSEMGAKAIEALQSALDQNGN